MGSCFSKGGTNRTEKPYRNSKNNPRGQTNNDRSSDNAGKTFQKKLNGYKEIIGRLQVGETSYYRTMIQKDLEQIVKEVKNSKIQQNLIREGQLLIRRIEEIESTNSPEASNQPKRNTTRGSKKKTGTKTNKSQGNDVPTKKRTRNRNNMETTFFSAEQDEYNSLMNMLDNLDEIVETFTGTKNDNVYNEINQQLVDIVNRGSSFQNGPSQNELQEKACMIQSKLYRIVFAREQISVELCKICKELNGIDDQIKNLIEEPKQSTYAGLSEILKIRYDTLINIDSKTYPDFEGHKQELLKKITTLQRELDQKRKKATRNSLRKRSNNVKSTISANFYTDINVTGNTTFFDDNQISIKKQKPTREPESTDENLILQLLDNVDGRVKRFKGTKDDDEFYQLDQQIIDVVSRISKIRQSVKKRELQKKTRLIKKQLYDSGSITENNYEEKLVGKMQKIDQELCDIDDQINKIVGQPDESTKLYFSDKLNSHIKTLDNVDLIKFPHLETSTRPLIAKIKGIQKKLDQIINEGKLTKIHDALTDIIRIMEKLDFDSSQTVINQIYERIIKELKENNQIEPFNSEQDLSKRLNEQKANELLDQIKGREFYFKNYPEVSYKLENVNREIFNVKSNQQNHKSVDILNGLKSNLEELDCRLFQDLEERKQKYLNEINTLFITFAEKSEDHLITINQDLQNIKCIVDNLNHEHNPQNIKEIKKQLKIMEFNNSQLQPLTVQQVEMKTINAQFVAELEQQIRKKESVVKSYKEASMQLADIKREIENAKSNMGNINNLNDCILQLDRIDLKGFSDLTKKKCQYVKEIKTILKSVEVADNLNKRSESSLNINKNAQTLSTNSKQHRRIKTMATKDNTYQSAFNELENICKEIQEKSVSTNAIQNTDDLNQIILSLDQIQCEVYPDLKNKKRQSMGEIKSLIQKATTKDEFNKIQLKLKNIQENINFLNNDSDKQTIALLKTMINDELLNNDKTLASSTKDIENQELNKRIGNSMLQELKEKESLIQRYQRLSKNLEVVRKDLDEKAVFIKDQETLNEYIHNLDQIHCEKFSDLKEKKLEYLNKVKSLIQKVPKSKNNDEFNKIQLSLKKIKENIDILGNDKQTIALLKTMINDELINNNRTPVLCTKDAQNQELNKQVGNSMLQEIKEKESMIESYQKLSTDLEVVGKDLDEKAMFIKDQESLNEYILSLDQIQCEKFSDLKEKKRECLNKVKSLMQIVSKSKKNDSANMEHTHHYSLRQKKRPSTISQEELSKKRRTTAEEQINLLNEKIVIAKERLLRGDIEGDFLENLNECLQELDHVDVNNLQLKKSLIETAKSLLAIANVKQKLISFKENLNSFAGDTGDPLYFTLDEKIIEIINTPIKTTNCEDLKELVTQEARNLQKIFREKAVSNKKVDKHKQYADVMSYINQETINLQKEIKNFTYDVNYFNHLERQIDTCFKELDKINTRLYTEFKNEKKKLVNKLTQLEKELSEKNCPAPSIAKETDAQKFTLKIEQVKEELKNFDGGPEDVEYYNLDKEIMTLIQEIRESKEIELSEKKKLVETTKTLKGTLYKIVKPINPDDPEFVSKINRKLRRTEEQLIKLEQDIKNLTGSEEENTIHYLNGCLNVYMDRIDKMNVLQYPELQDYKRGMITKIKELSKNLEKHINMETDF